VGRAQELGSFENHFYYMFVAVRLGSFAGIAGKEEEIHFV
jgi:hypothetical protein